MSNHHFTLTIKDILQRKNFENATLIAGEKGLSRTVKWVHVFEVTEVGSLLNGEELILSTGFGWREDESLLISFMKQLIDSNASGLCIEVGKYTKGISSTVKEIADRNQFPVILFNQEVPFVKITQDIHSYLINQHYELISNLESYSQRLNKKLLSINSYHEILKFLHNYLNLQVVYVSDNGNFHFIPEISDIQKRKITEKIIENKEVNKFLTQGVQVLEREYGNVFLFSEERDMGEFESLLLDRTVTALAQHLLRDLYIEEKRKAEEVEWIQEWLDGVHSDEQVKNHLSYYENPKNLKGAVVCIINTRSKKEQFLTDGTYLKMYVQSIFDQRGFFVLTMEKRNYIIFILLNKRNMKDWKKRAEEGVVKLLSKYAPTIDKFNIGVGQFVTNLAKVNNSYLTAIETLSLQEKIQVDKRKYFYDDLHMYRLVSLVYKHSDLKKLVEEYLEPVISYDKKHNTNLMETLKTYLECQGSKKETAEKIFIVRQTLYHRIEKLEKLLGSDFMASQKRQVLEFSILAHEYLESISEKTDISL